MRDTVRTIHTYLGLFNFAHLMVFGTAGLVATCSPPAEEREPPATSVREVIFSVPSGLSDKKIAEAVHARLDLPLTSVPGERALRHDAEGPLQLVFNSINGAHRVTVEPDRLRVVTERTGFWHYVGQLHASLRVHDRTGDWRMAAWTWYVEVALWSFVLMVVSGLYLWLSARPDHVPAVLAIGAGSAAFLILYFVTR